MNKVCCWDIWSRRRHFSFSNKMNQMIKSLNSEKLSISTKLTADNYRLWYFEMAILLESSGCVTTDEANEPTFLIGDAASETQLIAIKECASSRLAIISNVTEPVKMLLVSCKNATDMWRFLFHSYSGENHSRKLQGIKNICNLRYHGGNMQQYVDTSIGTLHATIVASGKDQISLTELCMALLINGLPSRFATTRSILENDPVKLKDPLEVRAKILEEDERQSLRNTDNATAASALGESHKTALATSPQCNHDRIPPKDCWHCHPELHPRNSTCLDCGKKGHRNKGSYYCPKSPNYKGPSKRGGNANLVEDNSKNEGTAAWELPKPVFKKAKTGFAGMINKSPSIVAKNDLRLKLQRNNETVSEDDLRVALMSNKRQRTNDNDYNEYNDYKSDQNVLGL